MSEHLLTSLEFLFERLLHFPELVVSTFKSHNLDWNKTFGYLRQLEVMSLSPTHPVQPHLKKRTMTWIVLGNALGCVEEPEVQSCAYLRCPGAETSFLGYYICGACFTLSFCSMRCQQA